MIPGCVVTGDGRRVDVGILYMVHDGEAGRYRQFRSFNVDRNGKGVAILYTPEREI